MIYLVAIVLPFVALWAAGKPFQGILCLVLQITILGWIPAAIWAILVVNNDKAEKRHRELVAASGGASVAPPKPERKALSSDWPPRA